MFAQTEYRWTAPPHPLRFLHDWWLGLLDWFNGLENAHPVAYYALLAAVSVLLLLLLTHIGYVVWRITRPSAQTGGAAPGAAPVRILDARGHAARAEELARAGRYAEALGHLFLAVLLELDQVQAVRFHASKTPAEYVGEVRLDDAGRATFTALVARLYRHLFGALPCDELEYREFGATAEQLRRHVLPA